jgi:multimeric flavodoxin WrbA/putative sterol carrier protein
MKKVSPVVSAPPGKTTNVPPKEEKMSNQLRVVAINGSPHGAIGNTSQMIRMIGEGLSREGIVLEEIFLTDKAISYCIGCAVCLEKGKCWRKDDHAGITDALFAADGIILASPVYFKHVTAQFKTFMDRSLSFGHKPRTASKPGLAVTVSAGLADTATAHYLEDMLPIYGAFSIGALVAIGTSPGGFLGKEAVEARAQDLARDLARAIMEKKRYPATGDDLYAYLFMRDLVTREKEFMRDDYQYWQKEGILDGFDAYAQQRYTQVSYDPEMRKEWIKSLIREENAAKTRANAAPASPAPPVRPAEAVSCHELLKMMPLGFRSEADPGLNAVYQFEISGSETFGAYLRIADDRCTFHEGVHEKPDVLIKAPAEVWLAISQGALDGQSAFMSGKYRVEGNVGLLLKLKTLFRG